MPGGTDSSAYVSAADRWLAGEIYHAAPFHFWATWPNAAESASPVGYRPGLIRGTDVSVYPLGFPVFAAAAVALIGPLGVYLVAPIASALLTWCTFVLARQLGGDAAGVIAALLIATTPVTLLHGIHPMSDVPAAASWALAWLMATRDTRTAALAAGAAVSGAVLMRPNLAPLAMIPGVLVLLGTSRDGQRTRRWDWLAASLFAAAAAVGPAVVAWSQAVLYGGVFVPGYVEWESFFRLSHVVPNLELYPRLLMDVHTPLVFLGAAAVLLFAGQRKILWSAVGFFLLNVAVMLPYLSLDNWPFLRFLLPALVALFILFAATLVRAWRWLSARSPLLAPLALIPVAIVIWNARPEIGYSLNDWRDQSRIRVMGSYLREVLPANAAVLSFVHSGAVRHYTGRQVVRPDLLDPASLDRVVDDLRRRGYRPVFVLDEALESAAFRARFAQSRYGRLHWPPRAAFVAVTRIWYHDAADRDGFEQGSRWPVDVVQ